MEPLPGVAIAPEGDAVGVDTGVGKKVNTGVGTGIGAGAEAGTGIGSGVGLSASAGLGEGSGAGLGARAEVGLGLGLGFEVEVEVEAGVGVAEVESGAAHCADVPPLIAKQRHVQLPADCPPLTSEAFPVAHKSLPGLVCDPTPFADPQVPSTDCRGAVQDTVPVRRGVPTQRHSQT